MTGSTVPAVLAYLVGNVWTGTPTFVGEPLQPQSGDFNSVSWAGPENDGASATLQLNNVAGTSGVESYNVTLQLVAWQGTPDVVACIGRVFARFDVLWSALAADPTMGGLVEQARVADWGLPLDQTSKGAFVTLSVTVAVDAFRS